MDPQACLQRILDASEANDWDEYNDAFEDLATWLRKGGFSPHCTTLGIGKRNVGYPGYIKGMPYKEEEFERNIISSSNKQYAIMRIDQADYEFVEYDYSGEQVGCWKL